MSLIPSMIMFYCNFHIIFNSTNSKSSNTITSNNSITQFHLAFKNEEQTKIATSISEVILSSTTFIHKELEQKFSLHSKALVLDLMSWLNLLVTVSDLKVSSTSPMIMNIPGVFQKTSEAVSDMAVHNISHCLMDPMMLKTYISPLKAVVTSKFEPLTKPVTRTSEIEDVTVKLHDWNIFSNKRSQQFIDLDVSFPVCPSHDYQFGSCPTHHSSLIFDPRQCFWFARAFHFCPFYALLSDFSTAVIFMSKDRFKTQSTADEPIASSDYYFDPGILNPIPGSSNPSDTVVDAFNLLLLFLILYGFYLDFRPNLSFNRQC
ncbi:unnamed protein product [Ambrosiozyma monospora]|uniref:Unnamed protein product n=1 Tax=Ambrosiozyma monospora TaxID=43982 RepID=A0ACB5SZC5_AMBMO|nr:unnamed protein product [Ambrosiozyma monospora]